MTRFASLLFAVALFPRVIVALAWSGKPVWDGYYYDIGARSIAAGLGYAGRSGKPWAHYPVGYSAVLGGVYRVFGSGPLVAALLNSFIGAALATALYFLARELPMSERRARIAGLAVALYPGLIAYTPLLMTEVLATLSLVLAALICARGGASVKSCVLAGLVIGLGTLVRSQTILCAPAVALFAWFAARAVPHRRRILIALRRGALATALALAVVTPWTIRNCVVMDGCAFVSTNAGWNLAIGAFPRATGRFETLREGDGCHVVTGQVQQNRCWMKLGIDWIAQDTNRWIALFPKKLSHTFDHESFAIGYLAKSQPEAWPPERQASARAVLSNSHRALLVLAALACVGWPRRRGSPLRSTPPMLGSVLRRWLLPGVALLGIAVVTLHAIDTPTHQFWPLALLIPAFIISPMRRDHSGVLSFVGYTIASVCIVHAVFFGEDRYHLTVTPLLCLLAATLASRADPASPR